MIEIERWRHGARFAYSFVYENAFEVLLRHAIHMHDEFLMPASVAVLAGQIGELHNVPGSPYHLIHRHLDARELRRLVGKGWGIASHTMTHTDIHDNLYQEVVGSRVALDEAAGVDVSLLVLPDEEPHIVEIGAYARQHGYLAMLTVHDNLNLAGDDLFSLGRVALAEEGLPPRRRHFDPHERLALAHEQGGWVIDGVQCASPEPLRPDMELTPKSLARRFEKVRDFGEAGVWCATVEDVADYVLTARATRVSPGQGGPEGNEYVLSVADLSRRVRRRALTFRVSGIRREEPGRRRLFSVTDRREIPVLRETADALWFEIEVMDGLRIHVPDA